MPATIDPTRRNMREKNLVENEKIKVVPNWLKWQKYLGDFFLQII